LVAVALPCGECGRFRKAFLFLTTFAGNRCDFVHECRTIAAQEMIFIPPQGGGSR